MSIYHKTIKRLKNGCESYCLKNITIDQLKNELAKSSQEIVAVDEQNLRSFLLSAEGQLDMLQFTVEDVFSESLLIVEKIQERIKDE